MAKKLTVKERNKVLALENLQLKHYGLVLRMYPDEKQCNIFSRTFGCSRLIFNKYLAERQDYYKETGATLSVAKYKANYLNPSKKTEEFSFLKEVDKFALEVACENVEDAYDRFFKKQNRFPRFKSKKKSKKAYTTKFTNNNIRIENASYIQLPKVGKVKLAKIKTKRNALILDKLMNGEVRILNATVTQKGNKYYVSLCLEEVVELVRPIERSEIDLDKVVGIDLGLKTFATISNGKETKFMDKANFITKSEKKLAKLQRKLSKKVIGSKNYEKHCYKINRLHQSIANQRKDYAHKLSRKLVNENQVVVLETLNIKGMVKNKKLSKSISDAGWYQFITFLKYKLEWEGKLLLQIDRFFASSKLCSHCGEKKIALSLNERKWVCASCGTEHERDENASKNIRNEGLKMLNIAS